MSRDTCNTLLAQAQDTVVFITLDGHRAGFISTGRLSQEKVAKKLIRRSQSQWNGENSSSSYFSMPTCSNPNEVFRLVHTCSSIESHLGL